MQPVNQIRSRLRAAGYPPAAEWCAGRTWLVELHGPARLPPVIRATHCWPGRAPFAWLNCWASWCWRWPRGARDDASPIDGTYPGAAGGSRRRQREAAEQLGALLPGLAPGDTDAAVLGGALALAVEVGAGGSALA